MEAQPSHDLNHLLVAWRRCMTERGIADKSTLDELESHLLEQIDELVEKGLPERQAFYEAAARLGHEDLLATEYRKAKDLPFPARQPAKAARWSAGLGWSYLVVAWRQLRRHKVYALINHVGLTISIAGALILFRYVAAELSYDRFAEDSDRIYRLIWEEEVSGDQGAAAIVPGQTAETLEAEIPEIEASTRLMELDAVSIILENDVLREERLPMADANFLAFFGYRMLEGDRRTALEAPNSVVLTRSTATRLFGSESPLDREFSLSSNWFRKTSFRVTGVIEDPPAQTSYPFGLVVSYTTIPEDRRGSWVHTFVRLREESDPAYTEEKIEALSFTVFPEAASRTKSGIHVGLALQPLLDIHFNPVVTREFAPERAGSSERVFTLLVIGIFVVLIACVNYINISTARAATRAREVGVRKVLGSSRGNLLRQHLTESFLLVMSSFVVAIAGAEILLPVFERVFGKDIPSLFASEWYILPALGAFALIIWLLAGSYPAFFMSRWKPVSVLKGQPDFGRSRSRFRNLLVVGQFTASIILIVGSLLVSQQVSFMKTKDVGFDKEHVFIVDWTYRLPQREVFRDEVKKLPGVVDAAYGSPHPPFTGMMNNRRYEWLYTDSSRVNLQDQRGTGGVFVYTARAGEGWLSTLDIDITSGRHFNFAGTSDRESIILNETAVRRLGLSDPVGQVLYGRRTRPIVDADGKVTGEESYVGPYNVIGVVEDFNFASLYEPVEPMIFLPGNWGGLAVRVAPGRASEAVAATQALWQTMAPEAAMIYFFLDEQFDATFRVEEHFGRAAGLFTGLAIIIACLGIVGLAAFTAERRRKEIGIRKVLGATIRSIIALLSREFVMLVVVAYAIAVPLAYYGISRWLESFAYRIDVAPGPFLVAGVVALGLALAAVSFHALRAALTDPAETLRHE